MPTNRRCSSSVSVLFTRRHQWVALCWGTARLRPTVMRPKLAPEASSECAAPPPMATSSSSRMNPDSCDVIIGSKKVLIFCRWLSHLSIKFGQTQKGDRRSDTNYVQVMVIRIKRYWWWFPERSEAKSPFDIWSTILGHVIIAHSKQRWCIL